MGGGDCANCQRNAEIARRAEAHRERNERVTYPKIDVAHNAKLQQTLKKRRRLCEHTWLWGDCDDCKEAEERRKREEYRNDFITAQNTRYNRAAGSTTKWKSPTRWCK